MKNKSKAQKPLLNKIISGVVVLALISVIVFINTPQKEENEKTTMKQTSIKFQKDGELTFQSADAAYISKIDIEIADDDVKRAKGLMDRISMEENQGMLFLFPHETFQSFWMMNTIIPLDIIFVNRDKEIVTIHQNAVPFDTGQYASTKPSSIVVEVNAGYTEKHNINIGDRIIWRRN